MKLFSSLFFFSLGTTFINRAGRLFFFFFTNFILLILKFYFVFFGIQQVHISYLFYTY